MKPVGTCYVVATPIGNLEDITIRALKTLRKVDLIACEDTRNTVKLLNRYHIKKRLLSYHKHNENSRAEAIIGQISNGKDVAVVSDAGMPGVSDPGFQLIKRCIQSGIKVEIIPGAVALINALVLSGLDTSKFYFEGFLPNNKGKRVNALNKLRYLSATLVFYESPHKLLNTLCDIRECLGDRQVAIARELTKVHEEVIRDNISRAIDYFLQNEPKGEFVIVVGVDDKLETVDWDNISLEEHLEYYLKEDVSRKEAVKLISRDRGITKREVYEQLMKK